MLVLVTVADKAAADGLIEALSGSVDAAEIRSLQTTCRSASS